jgi:ankyrin repeat protein
MACLVGAEAVVKFLLEMGASVDDVSEFDGGNTTLHSAVCLGDNVEVVDTLLSFGANIEWVDHLGRTPLYDACFSGYKKSVKRLLAAGAKTDIVDEDDKTPLMTASKVSIVKLLLLHGADPNHTSDSRTALHCAMAEDRVAICRMLAPLTTLTETQFKALSETKGGAQLRQCSSCLLVQCVKRKKFKRCGGCLGHSYCSVACQHSHWRTHKHDCLQFY